MALCCPQRDAIEGALRNVSGDAKKTPTEPLQSTITLKDGRKLHLLGVSEGTNVRATRWQGVNVAVYGFRPLSSKQSPRLPKGLRVDNGSLVHAAVLLADPEDQDQANEHQVTPISRQGDSLVLGGDPVRYYSTIC